MSIKFKNLKIKLNFIISMAFIFSLILSTNVFAESNVPEIKGWDYRGGFSWKKC